VSTGNYSSPYSLNGNILAAMLDHPVAVLYTSIDSSGTYILPLNSVNTSLTADGGFSALTIIEQVDGVL